MLRGREFDAHWFETGTPAFLVDTLFERRVSSESLGEMVSTGEPLSAFDVGDRYAAEHIGTEALLFQTGAASRSRWEATDPAQRSRSQREANRSS